MSRLINLYTIKKQETINGFDNVEINDLSNLINHSIDHIYCGCIEYFDAQVATNVLAGIKEKIRPSGLVTLTINNFKHISRQYFNNSLSDEDMLNFISGVKSIFSLKQIASIFEKNEEFKTIKIEHTADFFKTYITIQRIGL
jgi:hypothetical protein